ncbi:MAG: 3-deoxy-D-manno-octulosonate 8-phosphate phosphatase [Gammaproteobacteria bacterium]|nr:3-deoxy-D-manno-octulosonate 8-phosphate phosphatase [Gammaproteobacteria bacterium]
MQDVIEKAKRICLAVFDVDGVLTNGGLILGESGDEYKIFHVRDGQGLVMLRDSGCHIAVITARSSKIVSERMASLGIEYVYQGQNDKGKAFLELMDNLKLGREQTAYVGDDVMDLPAMNRAGLAIAVADAHPLVKEHAHWTTTAAGGNGAAREVCDLIMQSQGTLQAQIQHFLKH